MITFQELLRKLSFYWEKQGCIIHQGYDLEVGAGTMNPATALRCLGPEPYRAAYIEPSRRPTDGRYGQNPNRLQHYFQYQVILKPSPLNMQELYMESLRAIGLDLSQHDIRFVHDDWENPTIGAWGLGWEVWLDGMEVTQYTYFQCVGGVNVKPVTGELTYGIERLAMYLQKVDSIFNLQWDDHLTYGDIYHRNEVEFSHYNFEEASTEMWARHFEDYEREAKKLIKRNLPLPAYEFVLKASHSFNILDARGVVSVTERTGYIGRIRSLAMQIAERYIESREQAGHPLLNRFPAEEVQQPEKEEVPEPLLHPEENQKDTFLLEIGSEELPAAFVPIACRNLARKMEEALKKEGIGYDSLKPMGAPRRIALVIEGLQMGIPPQQTERKGPAIAKAFDDAGNPTGAGSGFLRSVSLESATLQQVQSGEVPELSVKEIKGEAYLYASVTTAGKATAAILSEALPKLILNLDFPKKMRWADLDITYARPLQWIVALMGSEIVPFITGNLASGRTSRGHRQLEPGPVAIEHADRYRQTLKGQKVLVDIEERKNAIVKQLEKIQDSAGGAIVERERVIPQVLHLSEWPQLMTGAFDSAYLQVPKEVLISEMVEHQKYFPVVQDDGSLINRFIITADNNPSDRIREGNEKVLSARLNDGMFLYEKDLKRPLDSFNQQLKQMAFLKGLGTVYDKVERLVQHSRELQRRLGISSEDQSKRAAALCKADLASDMVFEFPELQGIMGHYYAKARQEDPEVALAIEEHWMPKGEQAPLPESETGTVVSLADKFDNLISCFAAGLIPTSSSDPYALRRQTLGIIKMVIRGEYRLPVRDALEALSSHFAESFFKNRQETLDRIEDFFVNRIKTVFQDYGFSKDEIEASVSFGFTDIYDTFKRVEALHKFRTEEARFPALYEVYKRAKGQLNGQKAPFLSEDLLQEPAEIALNDALEKTTGKFEKALEAQNYDEAYHMIADVQPALAGLFDQVKILADDKRLQENRIALLHKVFGMFERLLDFGKIREK